MTGKIFKQVYSLIGRYAVETGTNLWKHGFSAKVDIYKSFIPSQIMHIISDNAATFGIVGASFIPTIGTLFSGMAKFDVVNKALEKIVSDNSLSDSQRKRKATALVQKYMEHIRVTGGVQSWIDLLNFLIPIPFLTIPSPNYDKLFYQNVMGVR